MHTARRLLLLFLAFSFAAWHLRTVFGQQSDCDPTRKAGP